MDITRFWIPPCLAVGVDPSALVVPPEDSVVPPDEPAGVVDSSEVTFITRQEIKKKRILGCILLGFFIIFNDVIAAASRLIKYCVVKQTLNSYEDKILSATHVLRIFRKT